MQQPASPFPGATLRPSKIPLQSDRAASWELEFRRRGEAGPAPLPQVQAADDWAVLAALHAAHVPRSAGDQMGPRLRSLRRTGRQPTFSAPAAAHPNSSHRTFSSNPSARMAPILPPTSSTTRRPTKYRYPAGQALKLYWRNFSKGRPGFGEDGSKKYFARKQDCAVCVLKPRCTQNQATRKRVCEKSLPWRRGPCSCRSRPGRSLCRTPIRPI